MHLNPSQQIICNVINSCLAKPISLKEVHLVAKSMANGKSLGLNKFVIKFYTFFWDLIEEEFFKMIEATIKEGCLPNRMNKSLITLLF
jgi:hypothetical protein